MVAAGGPAMHLHPATKLSNQWGPPQGVAADLVHTGNTGYRAQLRDEQDMVVGLRRILELDDEACHAMRERCRTYGLQMCHPDVQVRAFETLCNELAAGSKDGN